MPENAPPAASRLPSPTLVLFAAAVFLPVGVYCALPRGAGEATTPSLRTTEQPAYTPSPIDFEPSALGGPPGYRPLITNVQIVDFDRDGIPDVLACDARLNRVVWFRQ